MPIKPQHDKAIRSYAKELGIDPELAVAVAEQESGGNEKAVSPRGAQGVMQIMPANKKEFTKKYGPDSRRQGVGYLADLGKGFKDLDPAEVDNFRLAAYNYGPGNLAEARKKAKAAGKNDSVFSDLMDFLPKETRDYVPGVLGRIKGRATSLDIGPGVAYAKAGPDTISDAGDFSDIEAMANEDYSDIAAMAGETAGPPEASPVLDAAKRTGGSLYDRTIGRVASATDRALGGLPSAAAGYAGALSAGDEAGAQEALTQGGDTTERLKNVGLGLLELYLTGKFPGASAGAATAGAGVEGVTGSKQAGDVAELATAVAPAASGAARGVARGARAAFGGESAKEIVTKGLGASKTAQEVGRELQAPGQGARAAISQTSEEASRLYGEAGSAARSAGAKVPAGSNLESLAKSAGREAKAAGRPLTGRARRALREVQRLTRGPKPKAEKPGTILGPGGKPARGGAVAAEGPALDAPVDKLINAQSKLRGAINEMAPDDPSKKVLIKVSQAIDDAMAKASAGTPVGEKLGQARGYYRDVTIPTRKTMGRVSRAEEPEAATRLLTQARTPSRFQRLEGQQLGPKGAQFEEVTEGVRSAFFDDAIQGATKGGKVDLPKLAASLSKAEGTGALGQMANTKARQQTIKAIQNAARKQRAVAKAPVIGGGTGAIGGWFGLGTGYALGRILQGAVQNERASRALLRLSQARQGTPGWAVAKKAFLKAAKLGAPGARSAAGIAQEEKE